MDSPQSTSPSLTSPSTGNGSGSQPIIEVDNLFRRYGKLWAVNGVDFKVFPGQVVGFIGANGAGKTTTMRIMATLEMPTRGRIRICGHDVVAFPNRVRRIIGWMPDSYGSYDNVTVWEYLDFFARAYGFKGTERKRRVDEVMEFTDLTSISDRLMDKLSKGMGQRLCLGRTLLHDPQVLILDEPAAGLDPKARIELKNLIRILAEEGKTIFISSHILSELGEMCDTLLFIDKGRIVHYGSQESLLHDTGGGLIIDVQVAGPVDKLLDWVSVNPQVSLVEEIRRGARIQVELPPAESGAAPESESDVSLEEGQREFVAYQLRRMIQDGVPVIDFHRQARKLEDAFVDMLAKVGAGGSGMAKKPAAPASGQ